MNLLFFPVLAACTSGGARGWAGRTDLPGADSGSAVDSARDTDADTDPSSDTDTDTDTDADSGLAPLEGDPCTRPIPTDATVVRDEVTDAQDDVSAWVCRAGTWSTGGADVSSYLESRANGLLSGTGGRAWVKAGGRLLVYAGPNQVWIEEGAELTVDAEGVEVTTCPSITFTGGPTGGC